jgi:hypothetical protein
MVADFTNQPKTGRLQKMQRMVFTMVALSATNRE